MVNALLPPAGNGKEYSSKYLLTLDSESGSSDKVFPAWTTKTPSSVFELFTYRGSVTLMTLLLMYTWFVHGASYYGLTIAASSAGGGGDGGKGSTDLYMSTAIRYIPAFLISEGELLFRFYYNLETWSCTL